MRTLKKTLCLVLAVVMVFGLFAVSASPADNFDGYTDANTVGEAYVEAVDAMMGAGIIEGTSTSTIEPEGTYNRVQAAKILAYMKLGTVAAENLPASAMFTDVPAGHWAAKYVAYCANEGIALGYGDGTFGPSDTLTGYQWTAMLLCAVGYDANGEYTGARWAINVAKDAIPLGVFAGDVVTLRYEPDQKFHIALAKTVEGQMTRFATTNNSSWTYTIEGEVYRAGHALQNSEDTANGVNSVTSATNPLASYDNMNVDGVFYLGTAGYVVAYQITATPLYDLAYVIGVDHSAAFGTNVSKARLLFADGTTQNVTVKSVTTTVGEKKGNEYANDTALGADLTGNIPGLTQANVTTFSWLEGNNSNLLLAMYVQNGLDNSTETVYTGLIKTITDYKAGSNKVQISVFNADHVDEYETLIVDSSNVGNANLKAGDVINYTLTTSGEAVVNVLNLPDAATVTAVVTGSAITWNGGTYNLAAGAVGYLVPSAGDPVVSTPVSNNGTGAQNGWYVRPVFSYNENGNIKDVTAVWYVQKANVT